MHIVDMYIVCSMYKVHMGCNTTKDPQWNLEGPTKMYQSQFINTLCWTTGYLNTETTRGTHTHSETWIMRGIGNSTTILITCTSTCMCNFNKFFVI